MWYCLQIPTYCCSGMVCRQSLQVVLKYMQELRVWNGHFVVFWLIKYLPLPPDIRPNSAYKWLCPPARKTKSKNNPSSLKPPSSTLYSWDLEGLSTLWTRYYNLHVEETIPTPPYSHNRDMLVHTSFQLRSYCSVRMGNLTHMRAHFIYNNRDIILASHIEFRSETNSWKYFFFRFFYIKSTCVGKWAIYRLSRVANCCSCKSNLNCCCF
jgi:hypothetical protein